MNESIPDFDEDAAAVLHALHQIENSNFEYMIEYALGCLFDHEEVASEMAESNTCAWSVSEVDLIKIGNQGSCWELYLDVYADGEHLEDRMLTPTKMTIKVKLTLSVRPDRGIHTAGEILSAELDWSDWEPDDSEEEECP